MNIQKIVSRKLIEKLLDLWSLLETFGIGLELIIFTF